MAGDEIHLGLVRNGGQISTRLLACGSSVVMVEFRRRHVEATVRAGVVMPAARTRLYSRPIASCVLIKS